MYYMWHDSYSVGYGPIDNQHQNLFSISNELTDATEKSEGPDATDLSEIIAKLLTYVRSHFSEEEALMKNSDFPDLARHLVAHQALLAKILELENRVATGETDEIRAVATSLPLLVGDWLIDHIAIEDQKYSSYIGKSARTVAT